MIMTEKEYDWLHPLPRRMITAEEHHEFCARDCEEVAAQLGAIAEAARRGNLDPFTEFWLGRRDPDGAEVYGVKVCLALRYDFRKSLISKQ